MKVIITDSAKSDLFQIYVHQLDYSAVYADDFQFKIDEYITKNLSDFPKLGHVFNDKKGLYRLIYDKRYNIYYTIKDEAVFVLYIIDGPLNFNSILLNPDIELPE
tara:strand:- start:84 stop:398 length:315 start_codon:yes stop_codon:yes gene_type:complete